MKKFLGLIVTFTLVFALSGCWNGEIAVTTEFEKDGSGTRTIVLEVMDDTLSTDPITNPDDPEGTEGKGAVINNKHIEGGLPEIQTWLTDNAPTWMTVEDMTVDGYTRMFTLTYDFTDFDDFLDKYEQLVDLSPNMNWSDFEASELPTFVCEGTFTKTCTFNESKEIVTASFDWAIDGVYTDIYDEADLAGFVTKADIATLADYKVSLNGDVVEEHHAYDAEAADGDTDTGAVVYPSGPTWEVATEYANVTVWAVSIVAGIAIIGGIVFAVFKFKK